MTEIDGQPGLELHTDDGFEAAHQQLEQGHRAIAELYAHTDPDSPEYEHLAVAEGAFAIGLAHLAYIARARRPQPIPPVGE